MGLSVCSQVEDAKNFVTNFCTYLVIVERFIPAVLDGAGGTLQGAVSSLVCKFISACTYSAWPKTYNASRLHRFQEKDVATRTKVINRILGTTSCYAAQTNH
jgi:hypothetical protein